MIRIRINFIFAVFIVACVFSSLPLQTPAQEAPAIKVFSYSEEAPMRLVNQNGDLERVSGARFVSVSAYGQGYQIRPGEGRNQSTAACCENPAGTGAYGLQWSISLNQKRPEAVHFSGWSRAEDVEGAPNSDYSLYVDLIYQDGTPLWGQNVPFSVGTHDWEYKQVVVIPEKPIRQLSCYALFRNQKGRVWFDDLAVRVWETPEGLQLLDTLAAYVQPPVSMPGETMESKTEDGLAVSLHPRDGRIAAVRLGENPVPLSGSPSGFLARDVAAGSDYYPLINGHSEPLGLEMQFTAEARPRAIYLSGKLKDLTGKPRAVSLLYAVPLEAAGWRWWDHPRASRAIEDPEEYSNPVTIGTGTNGKMSRYPFACVTSDTAGLALGIDMGSPAQWRLGYSAGLKMLYIAYDFSLHPATERFPSQAPFAFVLYQTGPAWGFRAAAEKYYRIFPSFFEVRSKDQGIWMPFTDVSTVQGWQDFGFKYHEGTNNVQFDDQNNILSFRYSEPSTWWMSMPEETPRTYEAAMEMVKQYAESEDSSSRRTRARSLLASGSHDSEGRFQMQFRNEPWANGAVFSLNPSPYLPGEITNASEMWNAQIAERLYGPAARYEQDGEYLDSLEGYVTADLNFREEHFKYVSVPLTFTLDTRRPVIYKAFSFYEFTRFLSGEVHRLGKLMFANSVPHRYSFLCPWLDVMGTESNWIQNNQFVPDSDEIMNYRRVLCAQKPYLFLMNTRFENLTPERVEQYFQRCLFYGMFPSMFSHNAADDPYWRNPALYNRDRELFKKYQPVIKKVAEAGWEPVTYVRSSEPDVWVERFGPDSEGNWYITVLNSSARSNTCKLTGEGPLAVKTDWEDAVNHQSGTWDNGVECSLNAGQVQVFHLLIKNGSESSIREFGRI
ncbi:MAG TPA: hypothetical protein PK878_04060 [bacterium]|nr:hypothetical protein [bacterium]